jgi:hypothetical protein
MKQVMTRHAAENVYLHRDFHGALSCGIEYLHRHFGAAAVRQYLREFTLAYYAPLRAELKQRGLVALEAHFERLYRIEGGDAQIELESDTLTIRVNRCPAVTHMREHGYEVAELFHETTRTVNEALCAGTPFCAELLDYEPRTGAGIQRFRRSTS